QYNAELVGFYNYYALAINSGVLNNFKYIMQYSMFKTLANKYRTSKTAIIKKMRLGKDYGFKYQAGGKEKVKLFYNGGFKRKKPQFQYDYDVIPNTARYGARTSLIDRLSAEVCEFCGKTGVPLQMHHVRKLKNLSGKQPWEQFMIARKRKTLAVCEECHRKIHNGMMN
ncbi:MAG: group II intron reverse transcriptase/maturase, partial [Firmicutes bacterium]|nr:group II intron reverse transcriptase/maturase [Bacillota bacterium]